MRSVRIVSEFEDFVFQRSVWNVLNLLKYANLAFLHTFMHKTIFDKFFHSSSYMRLTFHLDCEELIFDRISRNTYLNWMGLVSLWSRSENISYELKLIFSSFGRTFIVRAWICGCSAYVHQVWQFEQLWTISRLEYKYITHSYVYSKFQKDFTTCKFQAIFLWPFTSPQACNWWIFESS